MENEKNDGHGIYQTLPDRVTNLEVARRYDVRELQKHLEQNLRDAERAEKERQEILAAIRTNTDAIHNANLAGKILTKAIMIVAATPAVAYTIVKIVQEFFPPKTPLHAIIFSAIASSMLFAATPALANYVDAVASVVYVPSCSSPMRLGPASRRPIFFGDPHASLGSDPGCPGWFDNR